MPHLPTAPVAASTLVLGYLVADLTGVRWLGGLVLVAGVAFCVLLWRPRVGVARTALLVAGLAALFVASHLLARAVGGWPAVLLVAAAMFAVTFLVADRAGEHTGRPVTGVDGRTGHRR